VPQATLQDSATWEVPPAETRTERTAASYVRLSLMGIGAMLFCAALVLYCLFAITSRVALSLPQRMVLYVLLCLLLACAYAFHLVALMARERAVQREWELRMRRALFKMGGSLAALIAARDPFTADHQRRVAQLARGIAREMGFSEPRIQVLHFIASIHDVGKIRVPAEILAHPGQLTEHQRALIQTHSEVGARVLDEMKLPWPAAEIVHQHHERLDGSGYDRGLSGDQIHMEARILAVADTVEAMHSHRPYRPALGTDAALEEIITNRGKLYDPQVVDACVRQFREKGFAFADPISPRDTAHALAAASAAAQSLRG